MQTLPRLKALSGFFATSAIAFLALEGVADAQPLTVNMQVCVDIDTDFHDVYDPYAPNLKVIAYEMPSAPVDDIWSTAGAHPFRGGRIRWREAGGGAWTYGWLSDGSDGEATGCRLLAGLEPSRNYDFEVSSRAKVDGHKIWVSPPDDRNGVYGHSTVFLTPLAGSGTANWTETISSDAHQIAATLAFALHREDGGHQGLDLHVFYRFSDAYGELPYSAKVLTEGSSSCWTDYLNEAQPTDMCVQGVASRYKYILSHELAHQLLLKALPTPYVEFAYSGFDQGNCPELHTPYGSNHELFSTEWNSAAWQEGFAHAYAAQTWNYHATTTADCGFYYYKPMDPDQDGTLESRDVNCGPGGFTTSSTSFDDANYFGDQSCSLYGNLATEYDWLRAYWDLMSEHGIDFADLLDIAVSAEPGDWVAQDSMSGHSDWPISRLLDASACYDGGVHQLAFEQEAAEHGVNRGLPGVSGSCP